MHGIGEDGMTTRDTRRAFLKLLDDTWPGVRGEFVAVIKLLLGKITG